LNPRTVPTISRNSTLNAAEPCSNSSRKPIVSCLKLRINAETCKCAFKSLDLSKTQLQDQSMEHFEFYNKIREVYSKLFSDLEDFYNATHIVCSKKAEIEGCLEIMMVSVMMNKNIKVEIIQELPFLKITGTLNEDTEIIIKSWKRLTETLNQMVDFENEFHEKEKNFKEFQRMVKEYSGFVLKPYKLIKADEYLKSALETASVVLNTTRGLLEKSEEFFAKFGMKKIANQVEKLAGLSSLSGVSIVHGLI
jgi:hypothetical protein